jgi:hypothetical protein
MSHLESKLNKLVILIVISQLLISIVIAIAAYIWQTYDNTWDDLVLE